MDTPPDSPASGDQADEGGSIVNTPASHRSRGRVVLGSAGDGDDWSTLRTHLEELGWQVVIFDAVPRIDGDSLEVALPLTDGVELAVITIARSDRRVDVLTTRRLNHLVGVLQGQLGFGRVLVLTESELGSFLHGTGVTEIHYERDNIQARFPQIGALLEDLVSGSGLPDRSPPFVEGRSLRERLGLAGGRLAPEMLIAIGVMLVLLSVLLVSAWELVGGGGDEAAASRAGDTTAPGDPEVGGGVTSTGLQTGNSGSAGDLPARCTIDTSPRSVQPEVVLCEGVGGVRAEGDLGPWNDRISTITMDQGVLGQVHLVSADAAPSNGVIDLEPATDQSLEQWNPTAGVDWIRLQFSAHGQQVRIRRHPDSGDNELILTFNLDL